MTRAELLSRISASEFQEWRILEQIEPFGEQAAYLRAGIIASTIANFSPLRDPKAAPLKPSDFIPKCEPEPEQTTDDMFAFFQMLQEVQNQRVGDVVRQPIEP